MGYKDRGIGSGTTQPSYSRQKSESKKGFTHAELTLMGGEVGRGQKAESQRDGTM